MGIWARGSTGELQTTHVEGVPTFFVDTGQTPTASLSFRAGLADETLTTHGWLHLLEHMAMHGRDNPHLQTNASVGLWVTDFSVSGESDDLVAFLNDLSRWLAAPDFGGLEHERKILMAESAQRPPSDFGTHLDYRYGARGVGLLPYREFGLNNAAEAGLSELAARFLVRGNASLALNCPPPDSLRLTLADGPRVPIPRAKGLPIRTPGHVQGSTRFLGVSGILHDSPTSPIVSEVLSRALTQKLRHDLGSSYGTTGVLERVDHEELMLCLSSDIVEESARSAVALAHGVLNDLASNGVNEADFEGVRQRALRQLRDEPTGAWQAFNSAVAELRDDGPFDVELVQERLETLTREQVDTEIQGFVSSVLFSSPAGKESATFVPFLTGITEHPMVGAPTVFAPWKVSDRSRLAISPSTVELTGNAVRHGRALGSVAALLKHPDGARTLVAEDGGSLHIETNLWRHGERAVAMLDEFIDPTRHVPMDPRDADEVASPPSTWARLSHPVIKLARVPWVGYTALAVVLLPVVVILLASGHVLTVIVLLTFIGSAINGMRKDS